MKALKWFLVLALALLALKLIAFYTMPTNQGSMLLSWGGYDYRATAVDAFLILCSFSSYILTDRCLSERIKEFRWTFYAS